MAGSWQTITDYLVQDHQRLDALLREAESGDAAAYDAFRRGLLRHIGLEEKILLPEARRRRGGKPLETAARLRADHGALAALLVPPPRAAVFGAIRAILASHNDVEEGPGGVYASCEELCPGDESRAMAETLAAAPEVPVQPNVDDPEVWAATCRAVARAGYDPAQLGLSGPDA